MPLIQILLCATLLTTPACTRNPQKLSQASSVTASQENSTQKDKKMMLFNAKEKNAIANWRVVDDVVMGGRSDGNVQQSDAGNFVFTGKVSLENNGGFSSVRMTMDDRKVAQYSEVTLRLKGDGKRYQFRLKSDPQQYFSYIQYFETSGEWETITLKLADFYPTFRGRKLEQPNYPGKTLTEITFLIANGTPEQFRLEVETIALK